ncbi:hypothetical protein MAIT1_02073 [Magnetofaba australis IT-1]|uniref:Cytidylate kinase n=2 Tax=Magnetofaba TaxID=1472292 RepID=A0A1Y2K1U1_9PROT|nr:hypothetical protein MAIT1_02073 [Magnetofaba australis IT-1]
MELISALVGAEVETETKPEIVHSNRPPLVAVSRTLGADGTRISQILAEKLGVPFYDQALMDAVIEEASHDDHLMRRIDERATGFINDLIYGMLNDTARPSPKDAYYNALIKVLLNISRAGGVVVGRGSHMLLPVGRTFRVRFEASMEHASARISARENVSIEAAKAIVNRVNAERESFTTALPRRYPSLRSAYDMTINTDRFTNHDALAELVIQSMTMAGFPTRMPETVASAS